LKVEEDKRLKLIFLHIFYLLFLLAIY